MAPELRTRAWPNSIPTCSFGHSPAGEDGFESGFGEDPAHFFPLVSLDFDAALFDGAADSAGLLHLLGEFLFLGLTDSLEILHDGDGLSSAVGGLTDDVDPTAIGVLLSAF